MMDRRFARRTLVATTIAVLLVACGDKPDALLASAKGYLDKNDPKAAIIQIKNVLQQEPERADARFLLGKALLDSGDPTGAEVELRRAMERKHPADQVVPLLASAMLGAGQAKKVLADFAKTELTAPEAKADLQISMAFAHAALGQMDKGRAAMAAAAAAKPDHVPTLLAQARFAVSDRDFAAAMDRIDGVLAKDPNNHEAWKFKGDLLAQQRDTEAAIAAYRKAAGFRPDFVGAHAALITELLRVEKLDEAGTQLETMKKAAPKNPQTLFVEGEYFYQKKDYKRARDTVQEALKVLPNNPRLLLLAGAVQFQLNSLAQAEDYLARVVKLTPEVTFARRMLAVVYLRTGQPAKALATIEPVLDEATKDGDLLSIAGEIYMQNGLPQKAEEYFAKAAALDPKDAGKRTSVAMTHMASGKADTAFGELERIASADTGTTADMALISSSLKRRDYVKALRAIDGLEKKKGNVPLVHALRGTALAAKGDGDGARKSFEKALALNGAYMPAASGLARLDLKEKKTEDAKKRFENVLVADAKNVPAMLALAELKSRTGSGTDEVAALLSKAIQADPAAVAPRIALINLYIGAKEAKKAVTVAQDAAAALPDRPEVLDALGRAQQVAGDTNQALATFGKLATVLPNSPQIHLRIADIQAAAKNRDAAMQSLRKALELSPNYLPAQRAMIILNIDADNVPAAQAVARDIRKQRPNEAIGLVLEGDIAASQKSWAEAATSYRTALKQSASTDVAIKLYRVLQAGGKTAEADRHAASWLVDHPSDMGIRLFLAETAMTRKDYPVAIKHYQAVAQSQTSNHLALNNLAWAMAQVKDPRAIEYAEKANQMAPNQPPVLDTLATLLAEKGDMARAIELQQKAVELAPQGTTMKLRLATLQIKAGRKADARKNLEELAKLGDKFPGQAEVARLLKEAGG